MPKPRQKDEIVCQYYRWLLGRRSDVYFADGRTNRPPLGRHSLGTKDRAAALAALQKLDLVMAVKAGRVDKTVLDHAPADQLGLEEGWKRYLAHAARPRVTGGTRPSTQKRYRSVGNKFLPFARSQGISTWNQVKRQTLEAFAALLGKEEYAPSTMCTALTAIKQVLKWSIENGLLPATSRIHLPLKKSNESRTYCWTPAEVAAMVDFCRQHPELDWVGDVVVGLASTGLRISEVVSLRWSDVDFEMNMISLTDETPRAPAKSRHPARTTKSGRSRSFPIHKGLQELLRRIPRRADGFVFHGADGNQLNADTVRRVLVKNVLTPLASRFPTPEGEIGFRNGRPHSFRHYFCSACANTGVPEQVLMAWLGHANSRMIKRYYHLHDDEAQRQMEKVTLIPNSDKMRSAS